MHHAYLLIGDQSENLQKLPKSEQEVGSDVRITTHERFGIKEARDLKHESTLRPLVRPYRTFVLIIGGITIEAQNALLKLFEEPSETAVFYLIVSCEDVLIPTLRSRLMTLDGVVSDQVISEAAQVFLKSSYADRLELITQYTKEKNVLWIEEVLQGVEFWAYQNENREALDAILFVRAYDRMRSASKKMLLEHIALSLSGAQQIG